VNRARQAVLVLFFAGGTLGSIWAVQIPSIKRLLGLSNWSLGLVLLAAPLGILVALTVAGRLTDRFGATAVTRSSFVVFVLLVIPLGFVGNPQLLALTLFLGFGLLGGIADIALNAAALTVERQRGRPLMSSFHAAFSIGGIFGTLVGTAMAGAGLGPAQTFVIATAPILVAVLAAVRFLPTDTATRTPSKKRTRTGASISRSLFASLIVLGVLASVSQLAEGALRDWTGVYLQDVLGAPPGVAPIGYAAFSICMAIGRLLADRLAVAFGETRLIQASALTASLGLTLSLLSHKPVIGAVGFGICGLGLSCTTPLVFAAAGHADPERTGRALALVTGFGYLGLLGGPVLIGGAATLFGLGGALWILVVLILMMIPLVKRANMRSVRGTTAHEN
jgi:MFS family permease